MPGPVGRPLVRVSPDVSECSRIPRRRRPTRTASGARPRWWATAPAWRASPRGGGGPRASGARPAVTSTSSFGGSGWVLHTRCQRSVTTVQGTTSGLALERARDQLERRQVGVPLVGRRLPVDAVRLVAVEDGAPVDDVLAAIAPVVGELPVGGADVEVDRADADQLVPGEVPGGHPGRLLPPPVRHRVRLGIGPLVDAEQPAALRIAEVHDAVADGYGPAVRYRDREAGRVLVVVPAGGQLAARGGGRRGGGRRGGGTLARGRGGRGRGGCSGRCRPRRRLTGVAQQERAAEDRDEQDFQGDRDQQDPPAGPGAVAPPHRILARPGRGPGRRAGGAPRGL